MKTENNLLWRNIMVNERSLEPRPRRRNAVLLACLAMLLAETGRDAAAGPILEHYTHLSIGADARDGAQSETLFWEMTDPFDYVPSPVRISGSGSSAGASGSALSFAERSPGAFLGSSIRLSSTDFAVGSANAAWVDDILLGGISHLPVPEYLRMNLRVLGTLTGRSAVWLHNHDIKGGRLIGHMGETSWAGVNSYLQEWDEFGRLLHEPYWTATGAGDWASLSIDPLGESRWFVDGTLVIDLPLDGPDLPPGTRLDGMHLTAQTRFALQLETYAWAGAEGNLLRDGAAVFGDTISLTSITLPDGSTPESQGYTLSFASGMASPNTSLSPVPEPSSLALLGTGLLGLIGYRARRRSETATAAA